MAVKIPTYDSRTTPTGLMSNANAPQATGVEFSTTLAKAGQNLGDTVFSSLLKKEQADAMANSGKMVADAHLQWSEYLKKSQETATDGAPNFTGDTLANYDQWAEKTIAAQPNFIAQGYMRQSLNKLRQSVGESAINFEAKAAVADRDKKVEGAYQVYAKEVQQGLMNYDDARTAMDMLVANIGYDPVTRAKQAASYRERLSESFMTGQSIRNPDGTKRQLDHVYKGGFEGAVGFTFKQEGGYSKADSNGYEVNMGINKEYYPNVDVKNITKDQAKQIYKSDYWDKIGGDELSAKNPQLALAAFDTAVIAGVGRAKEFLNKSGGDVGKFMDMREQFLANLVAKNPGKYGAYEKAWNNRNAALRSEAGAPFDPQTASAIRDMNIDRVPQFINFANNEANRQQATFRAQLGTTESDHAVMFANGQTVTTPLTANDFHKGYGPVEGQVRWENYQNNMQLGADIQAIKAMPVAQQYDFLESKKPEPNTPGYANAVKRYNDLDAAITKVNSDRSKDPMGYAQYNKIGSVKTLNFEDPAAMTAELNNRVGIAKTMHDEYGAPIRILTGQEAATLNAGFQNMSTANKQKYLTALSSSISDPVAYRSVIQQIAPDSPVTAIAGMIMQKGGSVITSKNLFSSDVQMNAQQVSAVMLEGEALLNPSKAAKGENGSGKTFPMPKEQDIRDQFDSIVGKAFAGDPNGANYAYQGVKAYYAGKAAREGVLTSEGRTDTKILKEAVNAVIGGVSDVNGKGEVVRPWGWSDTKFNDSALATYNQAIKDLGITSTKMNFGNYGLAAVGDGKYALKIGTNFQLDNQGRPIVLDLYTGTAANSQPQNPGVVAVPGKGNKLNENQPPKK